MREHFNISEKELQTKNRGEFNWKTSGSWLKVIDSAARHALALQRGELSDPESGLPHTGHLLCNLAFLADFYLRGAGTDDRFKEPALDRIVIPYEVPAEHCLLTQLLLLAEGAPIASAISECLTLIKEQFYDPQ